jgi:hypothetical protein
VAGLLACASVSLRCVYYYGLERPVHPVYSEMGEALGRPGGCYICHSVYLHACGRRQEAEVARRRGCVQFAIKFEHFGKGTIKFKSWCSVQVV